MKCHNISPCSGAMEHARAARLKSPEKRAVKPSLSGEDGYDAACLPGLENTHGLHPAAIPWDPAEPIRWWVDTEATAKGRRFLLRLGAKVRLTSRDPKEYRRIICEAEFRNATPDNAIVTDGFILP